MTRRGLFLFAVSLTSIFAAGLFLSSQEKHLSAAPKELDIILKGCADYCARLESSVLDFVCLETVREEIFRPKLKKVAFGGGLGEYYQLLGNKTIAKNEFIYDYQLIRKDGKTEESLTLIRENGAERREKNAQLKTYGFSFKNIIFGPIVLLAREWQPKHNYEILREENIQGTRAIVIKATPKPDEWLGYLYGTVWVSRADWSVLRIAWSQESLANFKRLEKTALDRRFKPDIVLSGESGFEKSGLRFPSRFTVDEAYIYNPLPSGGMEFSLYKLNVVFSDYRFFTVETEVRY